MENFPAIFVLAFANIGVFGIFIYVQILKRKHKK